ncbi:hypothetical protein FGG08_002522 [Glutinoglossum americanum]|uniref:Uncharacterized protein n=1 Tax=Glutinoglossum americanum TaxID=1670608 RepID=A0A9P8I923_9PEZI|nr:hypothetical protein FGG08_002522 [Glutinoglossum americanum]
MLVSLKTETENPTAAGHSAAQSIPPSPQGGLTKPGKIGIGVGLSLGIAAISILIFLYRREKRQRLALEEQLQRDIMTSPTGAPGSADGQHIAEMPSVVPSELPGLPGGPRGLVQIAHDHTIPMRYEMPAGQIK